MGKFKVYLCLPPASATASIRRQDAVFYGPSSNKIKLCLSLRCFSRDCTEIPEYFN
jgi:hypothetical protein